MDHEDLVKLWFPSNARTIADIRASDSRFVYYTTAATALKILDSGEVWLRNARIMNDFSEIEYGTDLLDVAVESDAGKAFIGAIDELSPGLWSTSFELYRQWKVDMHKNTFIACLSIHDEDEDEHGRLSMWRAYGGQAGVAFVLRIPLLLQNETKLGVFSSPVAYLRRRDLEEELQEIANNISSRCGELVSMGAHAMSQVVFARLVHFAICTKHPAFAEEKEWRIISLPKMFPESIVKASVIEIDGVPQTVQVLSLCDRVDLGISGLDMRFLIDRVLIGPTEHAGVVSEALQRTLQSCNVPEATEKVYVTGIPLRALHRFPIRG